jgi:hypothetical protein
MLLAGHCSFVGAKIGPSQSISTLRRSRVLDSGLAGSSRVFGRSSGGAVNPSPPGGALCSAGHRLVGGSVETWLARETSL